MSRSIRFLGVAVLVWAGVRAISLGMVPGTKALAFDLPAAAKTRSPSLPPVRPTILPPIQPVQPADFFHAGAAAPNYGAYGPYAQFPPYPIYISMTAPRGYAPASRYTAESPVDPIPANPYFEPVTPIDQWPDIASFAPVPARQSTPSFSDSGIAPGFDRLQLSTWAMLRETAGAPSLSGTGTLGGSQAGARLLWRFNPNLAASLRTSAPVNSQRGGEAALGIRYQPFSAFPIAFTAERRQAFGQYGGRNAFALFAEGGLYDRPMPFNSSLDAYLQSGIVGAKSRDWFVDGQAAVTRPVLRNLSAGFGIWGGAQPGLQRLDAGPRASMRVGSKMRVHLDYRQKLLGNAQPGSGGVVTIAGDF